MFFFMTAGMPPRESAEERITRLMSAYGDDVLRVCYLFLKEHASAQDASQTTS